MDVESSAVGSRSLAPWAVFLHHVQRDNGEESEHRTPCLCSTGTGSTDLAPLAFCDRAYLLPALRNDQHDANIHTNHFR